MARRDGRGAQARDDSSDESSDPGTRPVRSSIPRLTIMPYAPSPRRSRASTTSCSKLPRVSLVAIDINRISTFQVFTRSSPFPSGNSGGHSGVPDAKTSDFCARSRKIRICAEAYSCTPHKEIRNLTPRLPKSAVFGREPARSDTPHSMCTSLPIQSRGFRASRRRPGPRSS